jgi:hypothetical protein
VTYLQMEVVLRNLDDEITMKDLELCHLIEIRSKLMHHISFLRPQQAEKARVLRFPDSTGIA